MYNHRCNACNSRCASCGTVLDSGCILTGVILQPCITSLGCIHTGIAFLYYSALYVPSAAILVRADLPCVERSCCEVWQPQPAPKRCRGVLAHFKGKCGATHTETTLPISRPTFTSPAMARWATTRSKISTAWHGHWNLHHHDHKMVIQFSDEGDVTNLDTLVVFLCMGNADGTDEIWVGRDSRQKRITLRLLDRYRECTECRMWHIV